MSGGMDVSGGDACLEKCLERNPVKLHREKPNFRAINPWSRLPFFRRLGPVLANVGHLSRSLGPDTWIHLFQKIQASPDHR